MRRSGDGATGAVKSFLHGLKPNFGGVVMWGLKPPPPKEVADRLKCNVEVLQGRGKSRSLTGDSMGGGVEGSRHCVIWRWARFGMTILESRDEEDSLPAKMRRVRKRPSEDGRYVESGAADWQKLSSGAKAQFRRRGYVGAEAPTS